MKEDLEHLAFKQFARRGWKAFKSMQVLMPIN